MWKLGGTMRRDARAVAVLAGLLAVGGCGDAGRGGALPGVEIMAEFESGAAREDVVAALPNGTLTPTGQIGGEQLDQGYLVDDYLIDGQRVVVMWLHDPDGAPEGGEPRATVLPVLFVDGLLDGWGWDHFDQRSAEWNLPNRWAVPVAAPPLREPGDTADAGGADSTDAEASRPDIRSF